jgi:hypothetical protein
MVKERTCGSSCILLPMIVCEDDCIDASNNQENVLVHCFICYVQKCKIKEILFKLFTSSPRVRVQTLLLKGQFIHLRMLTCFYRLIIDMCLKLSKITVLSVVCQSVPQTYNEHALLKQHEQFLLFHLFQCQFSQHAKIICAYTQQLCMQLLTRSASAVCSPCLMWCLVPGSWSQF